MNVLNVHKRRLYTRPEDAWQLIANLGGKHDLLWPDHWPGIHFDRQLGLGAIGRHGLIGYYVEQYSPPELIRFRVTAPKAFDGYHEFRILPQTDSVIFRHTVHIRTHGAATWLWLLVISPLHDAMVEDIMDRASSYSSGHKFYSAHPLRVRLLRWLLGRFPSPRARPSAARDARENQALEPPPR
ncbi:MAG: SRPBCC family protein [Gammaproteobacteria bacterium]